MEQLSELELAKIGEFKAKLEAAAARIVLARKEHEDMRRRLSIYLYQIAKTHNIDTKSNKFDLGMMHFVPVEEKAEEKAHVV